MLALMYLFSSSAPAFAYFLHLANSTWLINVCEFARWPCRRSPPLCLSRTCFGFFVFFSFLQFDVRGTQLRQITVNFDLPSRALCFLIT